MTYRTEDRIMFSIFGLLGIVMAWMFLIVLPAKLSAEAKCLARGFPKTAITWKLNAYCVGLQGETYTVVEAQ